jgi:hypothetical protein
MKTLTDNASIVNRLGQNVGRLQTTHLRTDSRSAGNSTYPKVAVQWLNQALCIYQSFCLVDSEVLRNLPLRQASAVGRNFKNRIIKIE